MGVGEDGAGGKEKGGGLEGGLANERLGRQTDAVGCGDGFSPGGFDVGFFAQNGEEAFYVSPGLMALGGQELQIGQNMSKGGLLLSHRIDIFIMSMPFFFQPFFSLKAGFSRLTIGNNTPLEKETSLFAKISHFFPRKFCLRIVLLFRLFQGKTRFFRVRRLGLFPKKRYGDSKPLSKEVGCGWQVGVFRSGWGWGSLPSAAGF